MVDQEAVCPNCGAQVNSTWERCIRCGHSLNLPPTPGGSRVMCPHCGAENPAFAWRCARCDPPLPQAPPSRSAPHEGLTISDIAVVVSLGMVAFSGFSSLIWFGVVAMILRDS